MKLSYVNSFIILRSAAGLTPFNKITGNRVNVSG